MFDAFAVVGGRRRGDEWSAHSIADDVRWFDWARSYMSGLVGVDISSSSEFDEWPRSGADDLCDCIKAPTVSESK